MVRMTVMGSRRRLSGILLCFSRNATRLLNSTTIVNNQLTAIIMKLKAMDKFVRRNFVSTT
jgi:hypothetical protein